MAAKKSKYKTENSREWLENWLGKVLTENDLDYERFELTTFPGKTSVLAKNQTAALEKSRKSSAESSRNRLAGKTRARDRIIERNRRGNNEKTLS